MLALISGDRQGPVQWLGQRVGLPREACYAQRSPEAKARLLEALPSPTLYVGDGVNDTLSLAAAAVGVAPLHASDAAREGAAAHGPGVAGAVVAGHVVLMPDVVIAELVANGDDVPSTWEVERADGRSVYVFRLPAGVVA